MTKIVVYGSRYGTTKSYAEEFARRNGLNTLSFTSVQDLSEYETVIHFGALLAGGVYGLNKTLKELRSDGSQKLIVVTVGLGDPTNPKNTDYLKQEIKAVIPEKILKNTQIYHLRGGIDYQKLSLIHRLMMYMVYKKAKREAADHQNDETNEMIATYNKKVSFVNFNTLSQIKI